MRSPKSEIRHPKQIRNSKRKTATIFGFRTSDFFRISAFGLRISLLLLLVGCGGQPQSTPDHATAARSLLESAAKDYQPPSAAAQGAQREQLQKEAINRFLNVVKTYPEQSNYCAQALRNVANIYAAQTNIDRAVKYYAQVGESYGSQQWELLQSWKAAADLLWENSQQTEARKYYQRIVERFDQPDQPEIIRLAVRGSKSRLQQTTR